MGLKTGAILSIGNFETMNLRRHEDIIAVRSPGGTPVGFHARNLQVAELSESAWNAMPTSHWQNSQVLKISGPRNEAAEEVDRWHRSEDDTATTGKISFGIRSLTLNVTQICNLHCTYCAAGGDGTYGDPIKKISVEKTLPQILFFLNQVPAGERFHIAFLGGEPLLYPEAIEGIGRYVLEEAKARGVRASFKVTTNGTLITEKALKALQAIGAHVTVSLDGPQEIHDLQRKSKSGQGTFEQVWTGVQTLLQNREGLGSIGLHAVFNEHNLAVVKAWDLFSPTAVDHMEFTYAVASEDAEASRVYNEALAVVAAKAWAKGGETELLRIANFASYFRRLDSQERLENHCGIGKTMLVVDSRNQIWNCPWTIGQKADQLGTGNDLDYDRLAAYQETLVERNNCGTCWARFLCGGGCSFVHENTSADGQLQKKNSFCERTRFFAGLAVIYYHQARSAQSA